MLNIWLKIGPIHHNLQEWMYSIWQILYEIQLMMKNKKILDNLLILKMNLRKHYEETQNTKIRIQILIVN